MANVRNVKGKGVSSTVILPLLLKAKSRSEHAFIANVPGVRGELKILPLFADRISDYLSGDGTIAWICEALRKGMSPGKGGCEMGSQDFA